MTKKRKTSARKTSPAAKAAQRGRGCPTKGATAFDLPLGVDRETADRLRLRPVCPRRRLPVPAINAGRDRAGNVVADFLTIDPQRTLDMAMRRRCAVCGQTVLGEYAFLSGPKGAANLASANPPAHEGCLLAAVRLCPYIGLERARRATGRRAERLNNDDPRVDLAKPEVWVLGVTGSYHVETDGVSQVAVRPAPYTRTRRFVYENGTAVEVPAPDRV